MAGLVGKLWQATKADGLMMLYANSKIQNDRKFNSLAMRIIRLKSCMTPANVARAHDAKGLQDYLRLTERFISGGQITAAGAPQFVWTGEIYQAVKYFDEIKKRENTEAVFVYVFILDEAGSRVKEFLIVDESDSRMGLLVAWEQTSATAVFAEA